MTASPASKAIASLVIEREWQRQVTDAAELFGWTWGHFRPAQTSKGWRTPVSGPLGSGYPDLILVRDGRLIFADLKAQDGRLSPDQRHVLATRGRPPSAMSGDLRPPRGARGSAMSSTSAIARRCIACGVLRGPTELILVMRDNRPSHSVCRPSTRPPRHAVRQSTPCGRATQSADVERLVPLLEYLARQQATP